MNTLGSTTSKNILPIEESYAVAISFKATGTTQIPRGAHVKLLSTGLIDIASAGSDFPIGHATIGAKGIYDPQQVTVQTCFSAQALGISDAGSTAGGFVISTGVDANGRTKYKTATTGQFAVGIALATATNGNDISVGIFRSPYKLP